MKEKNSLEEHESKKNTKRLFQSTNAIQYLKELSIVIIGVLVTLTITNAIGNYNRQQEIRGMMSFIKAELEENLENLDWMESRWEGEQRIFDAVMKNRDDIHRIPVDTLSKYSYAIGALYGLSIQSDSYDLLKNSMLMQYVKDKNLLRRLSRTYNELGALDRQLSSYSQHKTKVFLNPMAEEMKPGESAIWIDPDPYRIFTYSLKQEGFHKFLYSGKTVLSPITIFQDNREYLLEMIRQLDKAGY